MFAIGFDGKGLTKIKANKKGQRIWPLFWVKGVQKSLRIIVKRNSEKNAFGQAPGCISLDGQESAAKWRPVKGHVEFTGKGPVEGRRGKEISPYPEPNPRQNGEGIGGDRH